MAFQASADDEIAGPAELVHPEDGSAAAIVGPQAGVDDAGVQVKKVVRPAELIDVPQGMVLRRKDKKGRRIVFRPDQEYKCFTTPQWVTVGHMITDYRWLWYYAIRLETKVELRDQEIGNLELQLVIWGDNTTNAERGLDRMTALVEKEHDYRVKSLRLKRFEIWAWRIGTVVGLVAAGAFGAAWGVERAR